MIENAEEFKILGIFERGLGAPKQSFARFWGK
jgi:hypothetical protein